jgi:hypothetical protein|tara:strand:+ start:2562 stop:2819 length:258 start_codon:yes stop_codon:yes gene_type:complete
MPTYQFKNKTTGEEFEDFMSISAKEKYLEENTDIDQMLTSLNIVDPVGIGVTRPPSDFSKYVLGRIKETAPGPALEKRWTIQREH